MAESIASRAPATFEPARRRTRLRGVIRVRGTPKRDRTGPARPRIRARKPLPWEAALAFMPGSPCRGWQAPHLCSEAPAVGASPTFVLGSLCRRREPPHSCGGGALKRSENSAFLTMRFSAGQLGAIRSGRRILELSNPISNSGLYPAVPNRLQILPNYPFEVIALYY